MTELPLDNPDPNHQAETASVKVEDLIFLLRRKQSNWVDWGKACQQLVKAGYSSQAIFEETGFEPIQQNQVIVASQVYKTLIDTGVSDAVRSRFERTGSDILYELRILTQSERAAAAEYIAARNLDADGAREVAKAVKEFSHRSTLPQGFANHPGDAVAYEYWKLARQQKGLQERSRLIARGLMFAHTQEARQQIEKLLTEIAGSERRPAPRIPFYRIEADEEQPCLLPVAGQFPLKSDDLKNVPMLQSRGAFQLTQISVPQMLVAIPGWQVILKAQDPICILCNTSQLPNQQINQPEDILVVVDRQQKEWDTDSYFVVDNSGQLEIQWFSDAPDVNLLGRVILVLRPKKMLDEALSRDVWQIDE